MPKLVRGIPTYRLHKASGHAVVTLDGQDFYLGPHGTAASRAEYDRLVGEWQANGRRLPSSADPAVDVTIDELFVAYWDHAESHYRRPDGTTSSELSYIRASVRHLTEQYSSTSARQFGPLALKAVRASMIDAGLSRSGINGRVRRIKQMFKWGVENELVPPSVHQALTAVSGLRAGRSSARESEPVRPVSDEYVDAVKPFGSRQVWAMIALQRLTGMRSGEVTVMRGCDLDMSGRLWLYRPATHKTAHHGHQRIVELGAKAQGLIRPFLKADLKAYLFSPRDAEKERREARYRQRKTRLSCGNRPGTNRKRKPKCRPGERYNKDSYAHAIRRACDRAFPPPDGLNDEELKKWRRDHRWHPHQLRHSFATRIRKEHGLEVARVLLGHRSVTVSEHYAELDRALAAKIVAEVG